MAKRGRLPVLDEQKKELILNVISKGCSIRTAALYVGCAPRTIYYTADRDKRFAKKLNKAKSSAVVLHVMHINMAAKKEQYWRAAAWALERLEPEFYAKSYREVITKKQIEQLMSYISQAIVEEVPISEYRKNIMKRLKKIEKMAESLASGDISGDKQNIKIKNDADDEGEE